MFGTLLFPDLPSIALGQSLGMWPSADSQQPIPIVHERGTVVSPHSLKGMPAQRAQELWPHAPLLVRQPSLEDAAWDAIVEQVFALTPYLFVHNRRITAELSGVPAEFVAYFNARCGIASSPTMSLLAALSAEPCADPVVVAAGKEASFLESLPVSALLELPELDVDVRMVEKLQLFGLGTVGRLRMLTAAQLKAQFGQGGVPVHALLSSLGKGLPDGVRGQESALKSMYELPPTITATERFTDGVQEPALLALAAGGLCNKVTKALLHGPWKTSRIDVSLLDKSDVPVKTASRILRAPTCDARFLATQVQAMLEGLVQRGMWSWSVHLKLASLSRPVPHQLSLNSKTLMGRGYQETLAQAASALQGAMVKRFPGATKRVDVVDPWAYTPDRFAIIGQWREAG